MLVNRCYDECIKMLEEQSIVTKTVIPCLHFILTKSPATRPFPQSTRYPSYRQLHPHFYSWFLDHRRRLVSLFQTRGALHLKIKYSKSENGGARSTRLCFLLVPVLKKNKKRLQIIGLTKSIQFYISQSSVIQSVVYL
jgi:hypothetical protein